MKRGKAVAKEDSGSSSFRSAAQVFQDDCSNSFNRVTVCVVCGVGVAVSRCAFDDVIWLMEWLMVISNFKKLFFQKIDFLMV